MMKQLNIRITGRVQGIGYRHFAVRSAREFDIRGSVRNMPDGSVQVIALGEEDNLAGFIEKLRKGPTFSLVRDLQIEELATTKDYEDFHVEY
jgi:acylphosphatase